MRTSVAQAAFLFALPVLLMLGCNGGKDVSSYAPNVGGSARAGKFVVVKYKCGSCHTIPGIANADGVFGPPLDHIARRSIIAGNFPNTPATLEQWVMAPTSMKPATAMPDLGLSTNEARNVVAYLETLR